MNSMEIIGWISIIALCSLALIFIILELGPVIHTEVNSWKIRKERTLESREEKAKFKKEMRDLKYKAKKLNYMRKKGLIEEFEIIDLPKENTYTEEVVETIEESLTQTKGEEDKDFIVNSSNINEEPLSQEPIITNNENSLNEIESIFTEKSEDSSSVTEEIKEEVTINENKDKGHSFKAKRVKSLKR